MLTGMLGGGESNELFIKRRRIRSVGIAVGKMELMDDADASNFIVYDEVHSCIHPKKNLFVLTAAEKKSV
jgi:hypothetical protein